MTLPNWITLGRIALVPVFVVLAYARGEAAAVAAFAVWTVAAASDRLDGYLARRYSSESPLGQFLDPLADKVLIGAALVVLVDSRAFPLWAAIVIGVREIAVQILRTRVVRAGGSMPASPAGKIKTFAQVIMVGWWLLPVAVGIVHWLTLAVAVAVTVWSGFGYFDKRTGEVPA